MKACCALPSCRALFEKKGKAVYCGPACAAKAKGLKDAKREANRQPRRKCPGCQRRRAELYEIHGEQVCSVECRVRLWHREGIRLASQPEYATEADAAAWVTRCRGLVHEYAWRDYPAAWKEPGAQRPFGKYGLVNHVSFLPGSRRPLGADPDEGRTVYSETDPSRQVRNADPGKDEAVLKWLLAGNARWQEAANDDPVPIDRVRAS
jgi:hypothetical protein